MRSIVKKKQKMKKFRIDELSSVDRPAQPDAKAVIMKRKGKGKDYVEKEGDETEEDLAKSGSVEMVTTVEDDHAHVLRFWPEDGDVSVSYAGSDGENEHSHGAVTDAMGNVQIVMNAGHTHEVARETMVNAVMAMVTKQELDEDTLGKIQKAFPELTATPTQEDIQMDEELKKSVERLEAIVALPADHRAHFDAIEKAEDQDAFLAKSAEERAEIVKPVEKAEEPKVEKSENPDAIYTAADGTVFTKSDDPRLVAAIIEKDSKDAEIAALKAEKADSELEKRAEVELANLPGTVKQRAELLKSVESIENQEHREAALKALKAGNSANEDVTKSLGTSESAKVEKTAAPQGAQLQKSDSEVELDDLAKKEAVKLGLDPVKDFAKAYQIVLATPEGKDLYNKHRDAMIKRVSA
jgi:hypothetical protein